MAEPLRLPRLVIAGAPKSGTTSVFRWLDDHPQAHGSDPKEPCFFADPGSHTYLPAFNAALGLGPYAHVFRGAPKDALLFEGTASYLYSRTALAQVPDLPTRPKCLFLLREPAAQILSTYTYFRNTWACIPASMSFADYLAALRAGSHDFDGNELVREALGHAAYAPWLRQWRDRLGPERMRVVTFDALKHDPRRLMADLAAWLGIDPAFYDGYSFATQNESYVPRNRSLQRLNIALREKLPKGRLYEATRRLYRRVNARKPDRDVDAATLAQLRAEFAAANRELAQDFDLDLRSWAR